MPLAMIAPHSLTLLGPRPPTPGLTDSCPLIYVLSANILQPRSSNLDLFSPFTALLLGRVDGTFNLALNSILGHRPLWQR